jgi:GAF domain-containing protein
MYEFDPQELRLLNEIGRVLSATLDQEDLLRKVWEQLGRLIDVKNFYMASLRPGSGEILFDLEVIDGVRMPKRAHSSGNHIIEYIVRTRQPVLIRENYVEEVKKLGVDPIRTRGCFCGTPLISYDRAIGAMAVFSNRERTFDDRHLELLSALAGQVSIALENARLFQEARTIARHLSLLNIISRNAMATLNPDEMLTKIAEQLEDGLTYDHIGIGVLEYSTREIVVQAEAGKRRGSLGLRIPLGAGLIGHVARNGEMAFYRGANVADAALKPLLPDTATAVALPIFYAEQLHGILFIESSANIEFSEEEILLIRTLADLIAGALHNAYSFQKAQEQAITDGVTGLKNHRFFMDALYAEWRRSARADLVFALMSMDLDHFKFVNDSYGHLEATGFCSALGTSSKRIAAAPMWRPVAAETNS